jgi:DNA-binding transcriptional MerR regulator
MGFKIGEVAKYVGVKQYVLRYWETEFEALHPRKSNNGQRFYTRKDIEMALTIRKLLHEDRFSIEGARAVLKKMKSQKSQITPILEGTTQEQIVEKHQAAAELVLNKATPQASVEQVQKAVVQREKELHQYWSSSLDYLLEEIRMARKRLSEINS